MKKVWRVLRWVAVALVVAIMGLAVWRHLEVRRFDLAFNAFTSCHRLADESITRGEHSTQLTVPEGLEPEQTVRMGMERYEAVMAGLLDACMAGRGYEYEGGTDSFCHPGRHTGCYAPVR